MRDFKYFKSVSFWRVSYMTGKHLPKPTSHILRHSGGHSYGLTLMNSENGTSWKPLPSFLNWREHFVFFCHLKVVSNQFLQNLHFTEEHKLVRLSWTWYLWNAKQAKVLNVKPVMTQSINSKGSKREVRCSRK